jgi:hypothetical protein
MAGDWLKMSVNLPDKPEVWQIAGMLAIEADSVVGKLLRVWAWFDAHTEDGNAVGVTYPLVDRVAGVAGFAEAMVFAGWLHQNGSVMTVPHFERHNGKTAKNRALTNERVAKHRKSNDESNAEGNAGTVTKTVTREEKRREEENTPDEGFSPGFLKFWDAWPRSDRKAAKGKCFASWRKGKAEAATDTIVAHVDRLKRTSGWTKDAGQFIPAPLVYLNERRWEGADAAAANDDDPYGVRTAL